MKRESAATGLGEAGALYQWSARRLPATVPLYVAAVFVAMMAFAHLVVHSSAAVKSLALAAIGAIVPLIPGVLGRVEYRLTERLLERRKPSKEAPAELETVFELEELSHVKPIRHGFKYYKQLDEESALRRFWKLRISDGYSGEVHVDRQDLQAVLDTLSRLGVTVR
jgi:hypothetical protein